MNIYLLTGLLCILSFILTLLIRKYAAKHQIMDIPNERSSHVNPTPRGGGLAFVLTWYIGITILFFLKYIDSRLYFALLSGLLLACISIIDDLVTLKPVIRLSFQLITAVVAVIILHGIDPLVISGITISSKFLLYPILIIGIVWFINLYNFLDGIDGYASLEALTIGLFMYIITGENSILILIASVLGFFFWNWPTAKIFMGDVGSTQLGFILVILGIYFHNISELSIIHWMMLSSLFWFDATITLVRRLKNHEKILEAHKKHAYQRIVQSGFSHQKTIIYSIIVNLPILGLTWLSIEFPLVLPLLFVINMIYLYTVVRLVDKRLPFR